MWPSFSFIRVFSQQHLFFLLQQGKKLGKTFGGVHFEVPETFDFLENLYKRPLNAFDYVLLVTLLFQVQYELWN